MGNAAGWPRQSPDHNRRDYLLKRQQLLILQQELIEELYPPKSSRVLASSPAIPVRVV